MCRAYLLLTPIEPLFYFYHSRFANKNGCINRTVQISLDYLQYFSHFSPVANYLKCAQTVILEKCGEIAGNLTTEYIRRSSGEQMDSVCQKLPGYPEPNEEMCKSSPPVCPGSGSGSSRVEMLTGITVLMILLYSLLMNRA